mmetsp:Transcript_129295/g.374391  ORF Transcript_129295/g.374391 Transcript_129295/m.374391 type:complete len:254 (+) Transcript_129295:3551-4312(+)
MQDERLRGAHCDHDPAGAIAAIQHMKDIAADRRIPHRGLLQVNDTRTAATRPGSSTDARQLRKDPLMHLCRRRLRLLRWLRHSSVGARLLRPWRPGQAQVHVAASLLDEVALVCPEQERDNLPLGGQHEVHRLPTAGAGWLELRNPSAATPVRGAGRPGAPPVRRRVPRPALRVRRRPVQAQRPWRACGEGSGDGALVRALVRHPDHEGADLGVVRLKLHFPPNGRMSSSIVQGRGRRHRRGRWRAEDHVRKL